MKLLQNKTNVVAPNATYPFGNMKDNTGSNDGTPADTEFMTDYVQLFEKMMDESGIVANGDPDNETNGFQLYEAFRKLTKPYKIYTALLSQSGTNAPVATVLGLNEIGTIIWTRVGGGSYSGTLVGAFTANKTAIIISNSSLAGFSVFAGRFGDDLVNLTSSGDNQITEATIEIKVYD